MKLRPCSCVYSTLLRVRGNIIFFVGGGGERFDFKGTNLLKLKAVQFTGKYIEKGKVSCKKASMLLKSCSK